VTSPSEYLIVKDSLVTHGMMVIQPELDRVPATTVPLDEDCAEKLLHLIDALEDLDDVQSAL